MASIDTIAIFLLLTFCSLVAVSYVNRQQLRSRLVAQKIAQLKRRILELEELGALVEPLVENMGIVKIVCEEVIELIQKTQALDSHSHYLEVNLANARERINVLDSQVRQQPLWRIQNSDAAIARAQFSLNETGRIIRRQESAGLMEEAEMEAYIGELAWSNAMVTIMSLIAQGHQALNHGDILKAYAYYKKAQQVLIQTNHGDERRQRLIKEVGEMMNNRRKFISIDLMPEAEFNPKADSADLMPIEAISSDESGPGLDSIGNGSPERR